MTSHPGLPTYFAAWAWPRQPRTRLGAALLLLAAPGGPALAQEQAQAGEQVIDEIVVYAPNYVSTDGRSATKSTAPLVETPQSVSVISRDMIDLLNWNSLQDAMRYTAGVTGENFGPDERYDWLTVRGFYPVQYVDGLQAPVGAVSNTGLDLYGSESVEVLKGPAAVLYGQSPPGGIVNMVSRRPRDEFGAELEAQVGSFDHVQLAGDVTGPLSETVSWRLTGLYRDRDSQVDFMNSRRVYVAPALSIALTPATDLTLLAHYQDDDLENQNTGYLPAAGTLLPNPEGKIPRSFFPGEPGVNFFQREQYAVGYDFSHDFGNAFTLQQNLKYFSQETESRVIYGGGGLEADNRTLNRFDYPFNEEVTSFNVDTRGYFELLTGALEHSFLVGLDYRDYDNQSEFGFAATTPIDVFEPVYGQGPFPFPTLFPYLDQQQKQTGLYVQDQIRHERLVVTLSGRYDTVKSTNFGDTVKDREFTYRGGVNYVFDNGVAPYLQTATSFQPVSGVDVNTGDAFVPTTGRQVEAGVKFDGRQLDRDLKVFGSIAAYRLVQDNVLTTANNPDFPFASVQEGEVRVQGLEIEAVLRHRESLSLNFSYTYTDTEVTKSNDPATLGQRLFATPLHKISALVDYTLQSGQLAGLGAGLGVRRTSGVYGDAANQWYVSGVTLFDAIVHYDLADWRFALNANNLFDKEYVQRCSNATDCFYGTARIVTGTVSRRF